MSSSPVRFSISISPDLPTPNHRLHWAKRAKLTRLARQSSHLQARAARTAPANTDTPMSCRLTLVRGKGQRILDVDNLTAALKPILDGLVDAGWLAGDSAKWLTVYEVDQRKDNSIGPAVEVEIRESECAEQRVKVAR